VGRKVSVTFSWAEINHLRKVIKLAQANGHEGCGWCDKILKRIDEKIKAQEIMQKNTKAKVPRNYFEKFLTNPYRTI